MLQSHHRIVGYILPGFRRDRQLADVLLWEKSLWNGDEKIAGGNDRPDEYEQHDRLVAQTEAQSGIIARVYDVKAPFEQAGNSLARIMAGWR